MSDAPPPLFYVSRNGQQFGPYTVPQAQGGVASGHLFPQDLACPAGGSAWQPLFPLMPLPTAGLANDLGQNAGMRMILPVGRSGWAIAAGYLGLFGLIILPAPLALIVSLIAIADIRKHRHDPSPKHGLGRAVFGLIVGILGTAALLLIIVANYTRR